jgi:phosphonate transport system ATP-binding protein
VLHQPELATRYADRLVGLRRGRVMFDRAASMVSSREIADLYVADA